MKMRNSTAALWGRNWKVERS